MNNNSSDNKNIYRTKLPYNFNNEKKNFSNLKTSNIPRNNNNNNNNKFEDIFSKKMMKLDMNNDDADEIFNLLKGDK